MHTERIRTMQTPMAMESAMATKSSMALTRLLILKMV